MGQIELFDIQPVYKLMTHVILLLLDWNSWNHLTLLAQSAGAAEYTDCISAEG